MRFRIGFLAVSTLLVLAPARAQNPHITSVKGKVTVLRGNTTWPVTSARPFALVEGDRLVTAARSEAAVQLDRENTLNVAANAEIDVVTASAIQYHLSLVKGAVESRVVDFANAVVDIDTPSVGVRPAQPGDYRITLDPNGESEIEARQGVVEVFASTGMQSVPAGQRLLARGPRANPEFRMYSTSAWKRLVTLFSNLHFGGVGASASVGGGEAESYNNDHDHDRARHPEPQKQESGGTRTSTPAETHHTAPAAPDHPAAAPRK